MGGHFIFRSFVSRGHRLFGERLYRTDLKFVRAAENPSRAIWRLTPVGYHQRLLTIKKAVSDQNRGFDSSRPVQHQPQVDSMSVVRDRHLLSENRATKPFRIKVNRCSMPCCWRCRRSRTEYFISGVIWRMTLSTEGDKPYIHSRDSHRSHGTRRSTVHRSRRHWAMLLRVRLSPPVLWIPITIEDNAAWECFKRSRTAKSRTKRCRRWRTNRRLRMGSNAKNSCKYR